MWMSHLEDDPAASHVLVLDKARRVLPLLVRHLVEELGEAVQGDVVTVEVGGLVKTFTLKSLIHS